MIAPIHRRPDLAEGVADGPEGAVKILPRSAAWAPRTCLTFIKAPRGILADIQACGCSRPRGAAGAMTVPVVFILGSLHDDGYSDSSLLLGALGMNVEPLNTVAHFGHLNLRLPTNIS